VLEQEVDELLQQGSPHSSFKGVDFYMASKHYLPWLGNIHSGYNDYAIDGFTAATGIKVPVDRSDPMRGKKYAEWLLANAYEPWTEWRCRRSRHSSEKSPRKLRRHVRLTVSPDNQFPRRIRNVRHRLSHMQDV
jgi:hypothetical protein